MRRARDRAEAQRPAAALYEKKGVPSGHNEVL